MATPPSGSGHDRLLSFRGPEPGELEDGGDVVRGSRTVGVGETLERIGPVDHSRRLWTVLVFMIWHGIFVEKRIVPQIQEPVYPVEV